MLVKKAKLQSVENNAAVASGKISSLERKNWSSKKKKKKLNEWKLLRKTFSATIN